MWERNSSWEILCIIPKDLRDINFKITWIIYPVPMEFHNFNCLGQSYLPLITYFFLWVHTKRYREFRACSWEIVRAFIIFRLLLSSSTKQIRDPWVIYSNSWWRTRVEGRYWKCLTYIFNRIERAQELETNYEALSSDFIHCTLQLPQ